MSPVTCGIIAGLIFGAVSVAIMLPMPLADKRTALAGAFVNRFGIGFVICVSQIGLPGWATGLFFGVLLSLPAAIITKRWAPIVGIGAIGGIIIGILANRMV